MRRVKFIIPVLLFAGACNAPSMVAPTIASDDPSTSVSADGAWTADAPADTTQRGDSGILIGSGT
jgi:hypothetical protein